MDRTADASGAMKDDDLVTAAGELQGLLDELDGLYPSWRRASDVKARARICARIGDVHRRLAALYGSIASSRPNAQADAAAELECALAAIDARRDVARRLVTRALAAIEAAAAA